MRVDIACVSALYVRLASPSISMSRSISTLLPSPRVEVESISDVRAAADDMDAVAERYAHLVLALGQHDPDYVDAFYGPAEWKTQAEKDKKSLEVIGVEATELIAILAKPPDAAAARD